MSGGLMIEKGDSVETSVEKFSFGVEKKKYDLVENSVEKFPSQLNTFDLIDDGHYFMIKFLQS